MNNELSNAIKWNLSNGIIIKWLLKIIEWNFDGECSCYVFIQRKENEESWNYRILNQKVKESSSNNLVHFGIIDII